MLEVVKKHRHPLYCSFCGKRDGDVAYLVAGPGAFICNECVEMCRETGQQMLTVPHEPQHEGEDLCPPQNS